MNTGVAVPACVLCDKPVSLETAKADEEGQTVHEQCYVLKLKQGKGSSAGQYPESPKARHR